MPRTNAISAKEFVNFSNPSKSTKIIEVRHIADAASKEKFVISFVARKSSKRADSLLKLAANFFEQQ